MPLYRDDSFLVVHPGSQNTIFSFGLLDSLSPPQYKIPSVVYKDTSTNEYRSKREENESTLIEIHPIKGSRIVDLDAFNHLLKIILQSVISNNPIITINQIPLLLVTPSLKWSRFDVEHVTKYVFESLEFTAFNILDLSIASTFAIGASTNSLVVNVGHESTQVVPVLGYQLVKFASKYLENVGGITIDGELKRLLPHLNEGQINALKTSNIYEVLNDTEGSFYSFDALNTEKNDEDFDVASYVAKEEGGESQMDIDEKKEEEESKPNSELEKNYFLDPVSNEKIYIGKERFQGTYKLVSQIVTAIHKTLTAIPDLEKRQDCYENLIFVGSTFNIPGLKRAIITKLIENHLIKPPSDASKTSDEDKVNSAIAAYQQSDDPYAANDNVALNQVPTTIKAVKYPDYFPEWKKPKETNGSWNDVYFLGGQIYSKQIFGANSNHGGDSFLDADIYEDRGPQAIWDVAL